MNLFTRHLALIVEGLGDRKSFPTLVAKSAALASRQVYVRKIIEAGDWPKIRRDGVLEKYCRLASIGEKVDRIVVVVDLDDGCAKEEMDKLNDRAKAISDVIKVPVGFAFSIREYETWFLEGLSGIKKSSPDVSWSDRNLSDNYRELRDAKGEFEAHLGSKYRPSIDQEKFTKRLDLSELHKESRSFRKFVKEITGVAYNDIQFRRHDT